MDVARELDGRRAPTSKGQALNGRGLPGRKESRERSHEWRGSLGKRSQDGGLEEETQG